MYHLGSIERADRGPCPVVGVHGARIVVVGACDPQREIVCVGHRSRRQLDGLGTGFRRHFSRGGHRETDGACVGRPPPEGFLIGRTAGGA